MRGRISSVRIGRRNVLLGGSAFLLSGCGGLQLIPMPPAPQLYVLRPQTMMPMGPRVPWALSVGVPDAAASLDTSRIALTRSPTTMDYFANAAWTDRMPLIVQRTLIQTFENSGRIASVTRDTTGLETDFLLETEVRDFQARYDGPNDAPKIMIGIQAKLVRMPQRQIVGSLNATQETVAAGNNLDSIVMAFNQAFGVAIAEIATWALNQTPA